MRAQSPSWSWPEKQRIPCTDAAGPFKLRLEFCWNSELSLSSPLLSNAGHLSHASKCDPYRILSTLTTNLLTLETLLRLLRCVPDTRLCLRYASDIWSECSSELMFLLVRKAHNSGRNHLANVRDYYACKRLLSHPYRSIIAFLYSPRTWQGAEYHWSNHFLLRVWRPST